MASGSGRTSATTFAAGSFALYEAGRALERDGLAYEDAHGRLTEEMAEISSRLASADGGEAVADADFQFQGRRQLSLGTRRACAGVARRD
jgi:hypothetical protein